MASVGIAVALAAWLAEPAAARGVTEFSLEDAHSQPTGIVTGGDGALWFTEFGVNKIGRITTDGTITGFDTPTGSGPEEITSGPDGALWFIEQDSNKIGRITTAGTVSEYAIPTADSFPQDITAGPDGALWFTETNAGKIGRITTDGTIVEYDVPGAVMLPYAITVGPDGALWYTEQAGAIGRMTTTGQATTYSLPTAGSDPVGIATGSDGALWFTEQGANAIGRITPGGTISEFDVPTADSDPTTITAGSDGALWFTEQAGNTIGRITTGGAISETPVPTANAYLHGITQGPDGGLWFAETGAANAIGRITTLDLPTSTAPPTISGSAAEGQTLAEAHGAWTPSPSSYALQWQRCDASGNTCSAIAGATRSTYVLGTDDVGSTIRVLETATNADGPGTPAGSAATALVAAASTEVTEFALPDADSHPDAIALGSDGALWFTEIVSPGRIGRITTDGAISQTTLPSYSNFGSTQLRDIAAGPDGALWFSLQGAGFGRITTDGRLAHFATPLVAAVAAGPDGQMWFANDYSYETGISRVRTDGTGATTFALPSPGTVQAITAGPDGALWFSAGVDRIGRISVGGEISEFDLPANSAPGAITAGADGALWFLEPGRNRIGRITTSGAISDFAVPTASPALTGITAGPDGAIWFTERDAGKIGRISSDGTITETQLKPGVDPAHIVTGPDGALWFTESNRNAIGRIQSSCDTLVANLARNCSFEQPSVGDGASASEAPGTDLGGWIVGAGDAVDLTDHHAAGGYPVHAGVQALDLNGLHAGSVRQDVATIPGTAYRMSFALSGFPGAAVTGCAAGPDARTLVASAGAATHEFTFTPTSAPPGAQPFLRETLDFVGAADSTTTPVTLQSTVDGCTGPVVDDVVVLASSTVPVAVSPPSITGSGVAGDSVSSTPGSWLNAPTSLADQWLRCDATGANCTAIDGATATSYTLTAADIGATIRRQEIASNASGPSLPQRSAQTGVVTAPPAPAAPPPFSAPVNGIVATSPTKASMPASAAVAPRVSRYTLTDTTFRVGAASTALRGRAASVGTATGTSFKFTLSEAATVRIVIGHRVGGRRKAKRCVTPTKRLAHAKRCTRLRINGTLTRTSHRGMNSVPFSGRIASKALAPGRYVATLTATDTARHASTARTLSFKVTAR